MEFEWDEAKRLANIAKHDIDFIDAEDLFDGRPRYEAQSDRYEETRFAFTGWLNGDFVTAIWTWRGTKRRFISVRRARDAEERAHCQLHSGRVA